MNKSYMTIVFLSLALFFAPLTILAAEPKSSGQLVYKPPSRGAPASRIGGGTRGIADEIPELFVLAPDHTGLTTKAKPVLYWYMSKPVAAHLELTVINDQDVDPVFEGEVSASSKSGIQNFNFAKNNVSLKPGVEYEWFVSFSPDPENRSLDIISGATIELTELSSETKHKLKGASEGQQLTILAQEGIWYDAIDLLNNMISRNPGDANLKQQRADLLKQVGLPNP